MTQVNRRKRGRLLPALLAGSACALGGGQATAVQLSDIEVHSSLGQPLRASIAYALSPNEQIHNYCIYLKPGSSFDGLPSVNRARLTIAGGRINIAGSSPVREPMLALGLTVKCPYTANLTRSYTLMLEPLQPLPSVPAPQSQAPGDIAANRPASATPGVRSAIRGDEAPIAATGSYRVRVGDTLSAIASRIEDRPIGLWQAVDAMFAANPDAFIDGDMNMLKAGSLLTMPAFDGETAPLVADLGNAAPGSEPLVATASEAYAGFEPQQASTDAAAEPAEPLAVEDFQESIVPSETVDATGVAAPTVDQTGDLRPGDVLIGDDRSFVSPIDSTAEVSDAAEAADRIPETPIAAPTATVEPTANVVGPGAGDPYRLLYWLGGIGIALTLGLLLLRRRTRQRAGTPAAPVMPAPTIANDEPTSRNRALPDIDFDIGAQPVTERPVPLDADLSAGTGLKDATDIEVAQDFGFSATHDLGSNIDLYIPEGAAHDADKPSTDILPPQRVEERSILDREILPNEDDEYDLSMIVDATKQKFTDGDVTAKDLMAMPVSQESDDELVDEYTLNKEVDYKILEQDYEEEMTATQALNAEIAKAAIELGGRLDEPAGEDTAEIEGAHDELDITSEHAAEMFKHGEDDIEVITDLDDTGINEQLTAELPLSGVSDRSTGNFGKVEKTFEGTAKLPARDDGLDLTAETGANTELTEELPSAENDPTVEMDVESGHFSTKKSVG